MDEFIEFAQYLSEQEWKKPRHCPVDKGINILTMWLFSAHAGYATGQVVYWLFDGWFW
ncbi:MAG: hypothetical protein ACK6DA_14955 [Candidatus Kapaibacterium sp.]|jgi:hypothetical protein